MLNIVLYCCTFRKDLKRTVKLAQSIQKHNKTNIPFYISVPTEDVDLFRDYLKDFDATIFDEQDIFVANPKLNIQKLYEIRGGLRQQVIKSEFWRLDISENYLVLDSDCIFILILMRVISFSLVMYLTQLFMKGGMFFKLPKDLVQRKFASIFWPTASL